MDNASEFRLRNPILRPDTLLIAVGQSGESVDTLAAVEEARRHGALQVTVCNVVDSQSSRIADGVVHAHCGLEIGIRNTKNLHGSHRRAVPAGLPPGPGEGHDG